MAEAHAEVAAEETASAPVDAMDAAAEAEPGATAADSGAASETTARGAAAEGSSADFPQFDVLGAPFLSSSAATVNRKHVHAQGKIRCTVR